MIALARKYYAVEVFYFNCRDCGRPLEVHERELVFCDDCFKVFTTGNPSVRKAFLDDVKRVRKEAEVGA